MQFRQRSQKIFANFREFFDQSLKKTKKFSVFQALFSSKISFGLFECKIGNPAAIFSTKVKNVLVQGPKLKRKLSVFPKRVLL